MNKPQITIKDIAQAFGVAPSTVSRALKDNPGISQKVLTDSLRSMENDGLVVRTVYAEVPPRVEYSLSELGKSMHPIIDAMGEWGRQYQKMVKGEA